MRNISREDTLKNAEWWRAASVIQLWDGRRIVTVFEKCE
jgi:hypothetical protein